MQNILFYVFSTYECMSLFILIMAVFRFPIFKNKAKLLGSSLLFTTVSFIVSNTGLHDYNILIQIPVVILIFRFIFKENEKYSIWISISGYVSFLMIQGVIISLLLIYEVVPASSLQPFDKMGYVVQFFSSSIVIVISIFIKRINEGFGFDFDNAFKVKRNLASYKPYMVIALVFFIITACAYPFYFYKSVSAQTFLITVLISFLSFCSLIFFSVKRNREEVLSSF